jgi:cGMP-dependent protein kinase 2
MLTEESDVDCTFSGSTCVLTLMIGRTLYVANVGDSRIIVGKSGSQAALAVPLSNDHKPDNPGE